MTRPRDTVLLGALLVAVAAAFDVPALNAPGATLVLLGVVCELWVRAAAREVTVEREPTRTRVVEDEPLDVDVVVRSPAIGCPPGELADPFLDGRTVRLRPGRRVQRIRIRARFARRGRRRLEPPSVDVRDPLGMASRSVPGTGTAELLVLPRTEPLVDPGRAGGGGPGAVLRAASVPAEVDLDGLRPHRPGTSASRIYWPGLARGGELTERRLSSGAEERALVVLDARAARGEDLDAAVRAAASVCRRLGESHACALALPGMRRVLRIGPGLRGWDVAHVQLALVETGGRPSATALARRRGLLIWVSGQRLTRPPDALLRSGARTCVLVVPGTLPAGRPAFTVAGCAGYVLGGARRPQAGASPAAEALR